MASSKKLMRQTAGDGDKFKHDRAKQKRNQNDNCAQVIDDCSSVLFVHGAKYSG
jgi:hypothetical protein